jgi:uncharacterized Ntn-hydrolase superfamily protein
MFRVQWLPEAVEELARIWTAADSTLRQAVTAATQALDEELRMNPYRQSESREDEWRVLSLYPLAARIKVDLQQRIVWVLHVWRYRRRGM